MENTHSLALHLFIILSSKVIRASSGGLTVSNIWLLYSLVFPRSHKWYKAINKVFIDLVFSLKYILILNCLRGQVRKPCNWLSKVMFLQDRASRARCCSSHVCQFLRVLPGWMDHRDSWNSPQLWPPTASLFSDPFPDTSPGRSSPDSHPWTWARQLFCKIRI